jgi:hypothetical protein
MKFAPLFSKYTNLTNPYCRQLAVVGWTTGLDSVPDMAMLDETETVARDYFLLRCLSDDSEKIREAASSSLKRLLHKSKAAVTSAAELNRDPAQSTSVLEVYCELSAMATNVTSLSLSRSRFETLPDGLAMLTNIKTLDLSHNHLAVVDELPHAMPTNLTSLDLSHNQLSTLPAGLSMLINLTSLDLSHNLLAALPVELHELKSTLVHFALNENPNLHTPPPDVVVSGTQVVLQYLQLLSGGETQVSRILKVMAIGEQGAGKTSFIKGLIAGGKALTGDVGGKETVGIDTCEWRPHDFVKQGQPVVVAIASANEGIKWFEGVVTFTTLGGAYTVHVPQHGEHPAQTLTDVPRHMLRAPSDTQQLKHTVRACGKCQDNHRDLQAAGNWACKCPCHDLVLRVYDAGGHDEYCCAHHLFLTPNTLHLLVVNMQAVDWDGDKEAFEAHFSKVVAKWINLITTRTNAPAAHFLLVGTRVDTLQPADATRRRNRIVRRLEQLLPEPQLHLVNCKRDGIYNELLRVISARALDAEAFPGRQLQRQCAAPFVHALALHSTPTPAYFHVVCRCQSRRRTDAVFVIGRDRGSDERQGRAPGLAFGHVCEGVCGGCSWFADTGRGDVRRAAGARSGVLARQRHSHVLLVIAGRLCPGPGCCFCRWHRQSRTLRAGEGILRQAEECNRHSTAARCSTG